MSIKENIAKLNQASNLDEVRTILVDSPDELAERVWREIEKRRPDKDELLDLTELDDVSRGSIGDWAEDGCAATWEPTSWCWPYDRCATFEVLYEHFG